MLDRRNEQPAERPLVAAELNQWRERERIRLGAARGEDHVARIGFDQRRNGIARLLDQLARRASLVVHG